jgi:hypothetical protein
MHPAVTLLAGERNELITVFVPPVMIFKNIARVKKSSYLS